MVTLTGMRRPKMTTLDTLAVQERRLYLTAERRLGHDYVVAREATLLLTTFIKSVSFNRQVFASYLADLKKHQTLALLSIVRRHHVQAMMDFRQVLETASNAAYALAHPDAEYADPDTGLILEPKPISNRSYEWIAREFPLHSNDLKGAKDGLNATDAHSNLVNSSRIFDADVDGGLFETAFFDKDDVHVTKTDLLHITAGALCIMHLLVSVMKKHGGFVVADDWIQRANRVHADREMLATEIKATPRFKAAMEASDRAEEAKKAAKDSRKSKR